MAAQACSRRSTRLRACSRPTKRTFGFPSNPAGRSDTGWDGRAAAALGATKIFSAGKPSGSILFRAVPAVGDQRIEIGQGKRSDGLAFVAAPIVSGNWKTNGEMARPAPNRAPAGRDLSSSGRRQASTGSAGWLPRSGHPVNIFQPGQQAGLADKDKMGLLGYGCFEVENDLQNAIGR